MAVPPWKAELEARKRKKEADSMGLQPTVGGSGDGNPPQSSLSPSQRSVLARAAMFASIAEDKQRTVLPPRTPTSPTTRGTHYQPQTAPETSMLHAAGTLCPPASLLTATPSPSLPTAPPPPLPAAVVAEEVEAKPTRAESVPPEPVAPPPPLPALCVTTTTSATPPPPHDTTTTSNVTTPPPNAPTTNSTPSKVVTTTKTRPASSEEATTPSEIVQSWDVWFDEKPVLVKEVQGFEDKVDMATGWLRKKGKKRHNWNRRFFKLEKKTRTLRYLVSDKPNAKEKGHIQLDEIVLQECKLPEYEQAKKHVIQMVVGERVYFFEADTEKDLQEWMHVIRENARRVRDPTEKERRALENKSTQISFVAEGQRSERGGTLRMGAWFKSRKSAQANERRDQRLQSSGRLSSRLESWSSSETDTMMGQGSIHEETPLEGPLERSESERDLPPEGTMERFVHRASTVMKRAPTLYRRVVRATSSASDIEAAYRGGDPDAEDFDEITYPGQTNSVMLAHSALTESFMGPMGTKGLEPGTERDIARRAMAIFSKTESTRTQEEANYVRCMLDVQQKIKSYGADQGMRPKYDTMPVQTLLLCIPESDRAPEEQSTVENLVKCALDIQEPPEEPEAISPAADEEMLGRAREIFAKSIPEMTPLERDYVREMTWTQEKIQWMEQATGLPSKLDASTEQILGLWRKWNDDPLLSRGP